MNMISNLKLAVASLGLIGITVLYILYQGAAAEAEKANLLRAKEAEVYANNITQLNFTVQQYRLNEERQKQQLAIQQATIQKYVNERTKIVNLARQQANELKNEIERLRADNLCLATAIPNDFVERLRVQSSSD